MLEDITEELMERLHKKKIFIFKKAKICPRIKTKSGKSNVDTRGWLALIFCDGHFS